MKLIIFQMKPMITINQNSIKHIHSINTLKTDRKEKRLIKSMILKHKQMTCWMKCFQLFQIQREQEGFFRIFIL